jgi:hypothetical protein
MVYGKCTGMKEHHHILYSKLRDTSIGRSISNFNISLPGNIVDPDPDPDPKRATMARKKRC